MSESVDRSAFLRGGQSSGHDPIRPPWFVHDAPITGLCDGCGTCVAACPQRILKQGRGGCPEVDFARGGCSFCGACAASCSRGAFVGVDRPPWTLSARIDDQCLSMQGVTCRICEEHCPARAIRFRPFIGGFAKAEVAAELCSGCGACVSVCPSRSIAMRAAGSGGTAP